MPIEITILSGKGGTGKTSVTAAFAQLAQRDGLTQVLCDLDVDASNLPLLLAPTIQEKTDFVSGEIAVLDRQKCRDCGRCLAYCKFDALKQLERKPGQHRGQVVLDQNACEGCRVCTVVCSHGAIAMESRMCGVWYKSDTELGPMLHAELGPGEENSGRLISLLRQQAAEKAVSAQADLILSDGPPGIGCPAISAVTGSGRVVCVTEPTASGLHDLQRAVELALHFEIPTGVVINKDGLNPDVVQELQAYATAHGLPILGRIPYSNAVMPALVQGRTLLDVADVADAVSNVWGAVWQWAQQDNVTTEKLKACS